MKKRIGQRKTQQREIIYKVLTEASGPLSAHEIHQRALVYNEGLGLATVYRAIKLLLRSVDIHEVRLPDGQARYEAEQNRHHHHFHCRRCEESFCFFDCPLTLPDIRDLPEGFQVETHDLTLKGLCPKCSSTSRQAD
jgi:Fur family ferric uptake transcriptional regulator